MLHPVLPHSGSIDGMPFIAQPKRKTFKCASGMLADSVLLVDATGTEGQPSISAYLRHPQRDGRCERKMERVFSLGTMIVISSMSELDKLPFTLSEYPCLHRKVDFSCN